MYYLIFDDSGECVFETTDKAERDEEYKRLLDGVIDPSLYETGDMTDLYHFEAVVDGSLQYSEDYITPTP